MIKTEILEKAWKFFAIEVEDSTILNRKEISAEIKESVSSGFKKIDIIEGEIVLTDDIETINKKIKEQKAKDIDAKASLSDQLNLLADVCYILTEWMTEPKILEARKTLEDIRTILNK